LLHGSITLIFPPLFSTNYSTEAKPDKGTNLILIFTVMKNLKKQTDQEKYNFLMEKAFRGEFLSESENNFILLLN
jgi:hypothetical protein